MKCVACDKRHGQGHTHQTWMETVDVYVCENCAERGIGSIAIKDGTLCRPCVREQNRHAKQH